MDPPIKPSESDCCNSGCNPCILDVYEEQLKMYEQKKANLKTYANCISPTSFTIFELVNLNGLSKETFLYTFKYVGPLRGGTQCTDLKVLYKPGQHFLLKVDVKGKEFTRAYTPIPINNSLLEFTVLIKLYEDGKMSNYLRTIKIGSRELWRGPYGKFRVNNYYNHKFLIAISQGTGIAPIFSVFYDMVNKEDCYTFLKLLYCCKDCENIYLRDQLYGLSSNWNFTYEVFLNKSSQNFNVRYNEIIHNNKLELGDIQRCLLDKYQIANVLICGSDNFIEDIKKYVLDCNVKEENIFTF